MSWFVDETRCYRGGKQHRFEARFTEQPLGAGDDMATVWQSMSPEHERPKVYVHDICVWCGTIVKASKS